MRILECAQGTPEWLEARLGLVTASRMGEVLTPKTLEMGAAAKTYCYELIAERIMGCIDPWRFEGETADMQRGSRTEGEGRSYAALELDCDIRQVGFIVHDNERWGASPDGLIGEHAGLELKCPAPKTQIKWLVEGGLPLDHRAQCHGGMIVSKRDSWWFLSYCLGLPPLLIEVHRDDYTAKLEAALVEFNGMFDAMLAKIMAQRAEAIESAISRKGDQLDEKKDKPLKAFVA